MNSTDGELIREDILNRVIPYYYMSVGRDNIIYYSDRLFGYLYHLHHNYFPKNCEKIKFKSLEPLLGTAKLYKLIPEFTEDSPKLQILCTNINVTINQLESIKEQCLIEDSIIFTNWK